MVWEKFAGLGRQAASATAERAATGAISSTRKIVAERFLRYTDDTLLGIRGNIAVVQNRAPFNSDLLTTSFYDITKSGKDAWLKTKYVTDKKLNYIPFGIGSTNCHVPKLATAARQRVDVLPSEIGGFKTKSNIITKFFDRFGNPLEETLVTSRNNLGFCDRPVKAEINDLQKGTKSVMLDPINKPNNGTVRGYADLENGITNYSIHYCV